MGKIAWVVRAAFVIPLLSIGSLCPVAAARQLDLDAVQKWFDAEWNKERGADIQGYSVTWRVELWFVPPMDELERMRKEVANKPDHPDRSTLDLYENALRKTPFTTRHRLWSHGEGSWRYNSEWGYGNKLEHYWDKTLTPKAAWMLLQDSLELFAPSSPSRAGADLPSNERSFGPELNAMFYARLPEYRTFGYTPGQVQLDGEGWRVVCTRGQSASGISLEISGRWVAGSARGFVEQKRVVASPDQATIGSVTRFSEWTLDPVMKRWFARKVDEFTPQNRLERSTIFERAEVEGENEFERVTAIPPVDGADPIRGKSTFTRVTDHRAKSQSRVDDAREIADPGPIPGQASIGSYWQRRLGWAVAGSLGVALSAIAIRRRLT